MGDREILKTPTIRIMLHRAIKVEYLKGTKLKMTFQDGKVKVYDMARLFERYPQTKVLQNRKLFTSGKLTAYGVIWNDELDIDFDTVYENGEDAGKAEVPISAVVAYTITKSRTKAGLSQAQLAAKANIDQADISKLERGIANPSVNTLSRIAKALGTNLHISFS